MTYRSLMGNMGDPSQVQAARTSFSILEAVSSNPGASVTNLAEKVGMTKGGVYKHLSTLVSMGYLRKEDNGYYLSLSFLTIGMQARDSFELFSLSRSRLDNLADSTGMRVDLGTLHGSSVIRIYSTAGENESPGTVGHKASVIDSEMGNVILANHPNPEKIMADLSLEPETLTNIREESQLIENRNIRFTASEQEGKNVITFPVFHGTEDEMSAISVVGPANLMTGVRFEEDIPGMMIRPILKIENEL